MVEKLLRVEVQVKAEQGAPGLIRDNLKFEGTREGGLPCDSEHRQLSH